MGSSDLVLSSRFHWDSKPNPLTELLAEKRRKGARILDLTESNPTRAALVYPDEQILAAISDPSALRYDPDPRGILSAREAVCAYYAARGVTVDSSRVILTASTSEAYTYLFKLLTNPGDEILVPRPSYPLFEYLAAMESVAVRQYPLRYDGAWHIDFAALEAAAGPRTRAIAVVNPNNPTGSFLKKEEWQRLERWAAANRLAILSDEVFSDFAFAGDLHKSDPQRVTTLADVPLTSANDHALVFSMSGLSKIAGLPQMKLGWIVAGGRGHRQALEGLEWIADTFLSVATPVQLGLEKLLEATESVRAQIRDRAAGNVRFAKETFARSACQILNVEGGWYVVIQVPRTRSEEEWILGLLREADVYVQPGFFYDFESEAFLVVSLLTEPSTFREGIGRISRYLDASQTTSTRG